MGKRRAVLLSAKARLADLALSDLEVTLSEPKPSIRSLTSAVDTVTLVDWDISIFRELGTKRCNQVLQSLRNLEFPEAKYRQLAAKFKRGIKEINDQLPTHWNLWASVLRKYNIHLSTSWDTLVKITGSLETIEIMTPNELATLPKRAVERITNSDSTLEGLEVVWVAAKCFVEDSATTDLAIPQTQGGSANRLISDLRVKTLAESPAMKRLSALKEALDLPKNFDLLKPTKRTDALATCGAPDHMITDFLDATARVNILRSVQGSLRSVASGLNSYLRFCALRTIPPFPVTPTTVRRWSSTFGAGKSFSQYLGHLRKGCLILQHTTDWHNEEIKTIARGLRAAQDKTFAFPNFIMSSGILQIINHEGRFAPMAMLAYLSYLFSLRVPSETLVLEVADPSLKLTDFVPQDPKAIIGTDMLNQTPVLVIKFRYRKNIRGGCILIRPCLCAETHATARALCPVHSFWEHIRNNFRPGDLVFPGLSANSVNRQIKAIMSLLGYLRAHKYSSHAFRKGATQEILASGSTFATILGSGTWTSGGFRNYLDLQCDEAANISALLLETANSDSEDEDNSGPSRLATIRSKLPKAPLAICRPPAPTQKKPPPKGSQTSSEDESSVISDTSESESAVRIDLLP